MIRKPTAGAPNQITGPNAGGPRQFPIRTLLAARAGQFHRYVPQYYCEVR
jgi:hypothetical protein